MRTVLVKNGILADSDALRALDVLVAGDKVEHLCPIRKLTRAGTVVGLFLSRDVLPALHTETCTHYLALTDAELDRRGCLAKMPPPPLKEKDRLELWKALADRRIDVVASDAAGHTVAANEPLFAETFSAPHDTPGVETLFGVAWDEGINNGHIAVTDFVRAMSEKTSRILNNYPQKGILRPGSDADKVLVEPGLPRTVPEQEPRLAADCSLFSGRQCVGLPAIILRRGEIVSKNGGLTKLMPGRFLSGGPFPAD